MAHACAQLAAITQRLTLKRKERKDNKKKRNVTAERLAFLLFFFFSRGCAHIVVRLYYLNVNGYEV